jgi:tetratricopeptide (TPR) repeat protein
MRSLLIIVVLMVACAGAGGRSPGLVSGAAKQSSRPGASGWIDNDAALAMAEAKRRDKPLFVAITAAWCHTCQHMESTVFRDEEVIRQQDEAVWLHIDVDHLANEPFLRAHAYDGLPTMLVLGHDGSERARWVGALDAASLKKFIKRGEIGSALIAQATKSALASDWPAVLRVAETPSLDTARSRWERLSLATMVLDAKRALKRSDVNGDDSRALAKLLDEATRTSPAERREHTDDVSSGFEALAAWTAQEAFAHDAWPAFLDEEVARRKTREERAALDAHRTLAYLAASKPELAIAMLEESERDFPSDPNPPARLARIYRSTLQHPNALAAIQRARKLVRGPQTLQVLTEQAEIEEQLSLRRETYATYEEIARYSGWLPASGLILRERAATAVKAMADSPYLKQERIPVTGYAHCERIDGTLRCGEALWQADCEDKTASLGEKTFRYCSIIGTYQGPPVRNHDLPELGCRLRAQRVLVVSDKDGGAVLTTQSEVKQVFRIQSPSDAIQMVRILTAIDRDTPGRTAIASGKGPYQVTAYQTRTCGCEHPIEQATFQVELDGSVIEKSRRVITRVRPGLCAD